MLRGDTLVIDYSVKTDALSIPTLESGGAFNLTGCKLWFTGKRNVVLADNLADFSLTSTPVSGIVIASVVGGLVRVTLPPTATRLLPDGPMIMLYDLQILDSLGRVTTLEIGELTVSPDITRSTS
jgi:hypothetical protein